MMAMPLRGPGARASHGAASASPPSASPPIAVGSIIHALWPSGAWHELRIVGQTTQSWLTEFVEQPEQHEKYKVLKRDLSFAAFPGCNEYAYRGTRYRAYTDAGKAAVVEQQRQLAEFFKLIGQIKAWLGQVSFESANAEVRQIARIAGLLPAQGMEARQGGDASTAAPSEGRQPGPEGDAPPSSSSPVVRGAVTR